MELKSELLRIMESRGLSRAGLAYVLGYKSATSVIRVMEGTSGQESTGEFLQRMLSCGPLALTEKEKDILIKSIDRRELGEENEELYRAFSYFLENATNAVPGGAIGKIDPIWCEMLHRDLQEARITLFNCVDESLMREVRRSADRTKIPYRMDHYILNIYSPAEIPGMIKSLLPLLHLRNYRCRVVDIQDPSFRMGLYGADAVAMTLVYPEKREKHYLMFLYGSGNGSTVRCVESVRVEELLGEAEIARQINGEALPRPEEDLVGYLSFCRRLESGHAVYQIKPCFGLEQVPADIIIGAFMMEGDPYREHADLVSLLRKREKNVMAKKRPQYHVYKESDMEKFARTGRMADHPAMLRPFTPRERVAILRRLEERQENNPYFHLFFFDRDDVWLDDEVTLYEAAGLSIIKPGTDYNSLETHNESLLVGPRDFLEKYKAFYLGRLIRTRCRNSTDSTDILRRLIGEAEK